MRNARMPPTRSFKQGSSNRHSRIELPQCGTATLTVSYDVQAESTDPNRDFFVDVITKSSISTYCVTYSDADCVNVADSVYNNNTTMTTKTIDIPNVPVGARLAFGGRRVPSTSGQQRFFFDNLIIKVKSYGSVHIDIATPVVTLTAGSDNIIASWDAANNAAAYVVEYKKSADADWTVAGSTAELTYKVTGLSPVTAYDVRVKAVSGESSSDYSAVVSATTTEAPKEVKQKAAMTSESQIGLNWSISDFSDVATDQGDAYTVGLYTDEACTDFKWQFNFGVNGLGEAYTSDNVVKNCFSWSSYLFTPGVVFSGLTPSTTYYVKVTDVTKSISSVAAYKTTASNIVDITKLTAGSATAGQTILDEDFSEFHFGGYSPAFLSGYSSGKRTSTAVMLDPTGTTPMADADKDLFNVAPATHMGLFNTLYSYIPSTRLAKWSTYVEANTLGAMCIEAGCLKIGASKKTGVIVTPPLSCLSGTATLEVSFDAAPYLEGDISKPDPLSMVVEVFPKDATIKAMTNGKTGTNLVTYGENWLDYTVAANAPTDVKELTLTTSPAMQHFTQTLTGVPAGAYIGIGAKISDKDASTSQHRMYLDNIHIKVVSY
jgi:hypothetical protein